MMNADPPLPMLTTEQIQKCLEENKELIMVILEGQNQGKYGEIAPYQAKLQQNLTFLAKLADVGPQAGPPAQTHSQGQGMQQQQPQVAMSQQRPDLSSVNPSFDMNEQQQQQQHFTMFLQQPDLSTSKYGFQMNEQHAKQPTFYQQRQLFP
ncbi:GRF1-interacting factor [Trifolium repens]|nr:GRF1-interacting factor [Trifolium repens]